MLVLKYQIIIVFLVSFIASLIFTKIYIKKAKQKGLVVKDMYKKGNPEIPTSGGLAILAGSTIGLIAGQLLGFNLIPLLIFYFISIMFAFYGLADDLLGFKKEYLKVFSLFFLALPVALLVVDTNLNFGFFNLELGMFYAFIIAPLYVMVVANLLNMHSGFNGLMPGLSMILLFFVGLKSFLQDGFSYFPLLIPIMGALLAFMYYNLYPSKVLEGNIAPFLIGGALGSFIVIANLEWFGIFILIPHIINFLLATYWWTHLDKYNLKKGKFAKVRKDGTIDPPNFLTIKYMVCKLFRVNEWQAISICYGLTIVFCVSGLILF